MLMLMVIIEFRSQFLRFTGLLWSRDLGSKWVDPVLETTFCPQHRFLSFLPLQWPKCPAYDHNLIINQLTTHHE